MEEVFSLYVILLASFTSFYVLLLHLLVKGIVFLLIILFCLQLRKFSLRHAYSFVFKLQISVIILLHMRN